MLKLTKQTNTDNTTNMNFSSLLPPPKNSNRTDSKELTILDREHDEIIQTLMKRKTAKDGDKTNITFIGTNVASFNELVPLRQSDFYGIDAPMPSKEEIRACHDRTKDTIDRLLHRITNKGTNKSENSMKKVTIGNRKVHIQGQNLDPLQPVRHKNISSKIIAPLVDEAPAPILYATDETKNKKPSKDEKAKWNIPAAISSWKNPLGYTVGLEHRAAHGKSTHPITIANTKVSDIVSALDQADNEARESIKQENELKRKQKLEEERIKEEKLKSIADRSRIRSKRQNETPRESRYGGTKKIKTDNRNKSTVERLKELAYAQGREVSEKVIVGAAKATAANNNSSVQYDSRFYSKGANATAKRNEEQIYDNPLFVQQDIDSIYRVNATEIDKANEITSKRGPIQFTKSHALGDKDKDKETDSESKS